jgi:Adenylyl/Guanylyl and SMODS C-terminal sensor domain
MGIAASLFYSTSEAENCLDWRVRPSDEQYDSQKERWNDLADHLRDDLAERSGYSIASWLQGSYKFGTQVRPAASTQEFDIDLGVYFRWSGEPDDGRHSALDLKTFVQDSLSDYASNDDNDAEGVDEPRAKCSRVHFNDAFHIDVPAYHLDSEADARALATDKNEWEDSDPKAIYAWWKKITGETDRARCRRLVRYFKMWAALRFEEGARPSSILLTVLLGEAFQTLDREDHSGDDEFMQAIACEIVGRLRKSYKVPNPANTQENLNRLSDDHSFQLLEKLEELLSIADRALAASTKTASAEIWSEAFDHFFPVPEKDDQEEAVLKIAESRALATIQFEPVVQVEATAGKRTFRDIDKIGPIPKGCDINFTLANGHGLPRGAVVTWMVRNSGKEAEQINDLGHRGEKGMSASEHSAYRGLHYMDVAVKLNGLLIGSKRVPVTVTGLGMPGRNPPRPSWTKLR